MREWNRQANPSGRASSSATRRRNLRCWLQSRTRWLGLGSLAMLFAVEGCAMLPSAGDSAPNPAPWYQFWSSYQARFILKKAVMARPEQESPHLLTTVIG